MAATEKHFVVEPMNVGAEIKNFDLDMLGDPAVREGLYAAWLEHGLLKFHVPGITDAQHLELSRVFGDLERHPMPELWAKGEPLLIELGGTRRSPAYFYDDDEHPIVGRIPWHRDTAYTVDICKGAMLHLVQVPESGGETLFADTALAYDRLPDEMKARFADMEYKATLRLGQFDQTRPGALWRKVRAATEAEFPGGPRNEAVKAEVRDRYPSVVHPVIVTHPESHRTCLYPSPTYVDYFIGLPQDESDALLVTIADAMTDPAVRYVHSWEIDDLLVWDNRRMMHAAAGYPAGMSRTGYRTTLAGSMHTGRQFDENDTATLPLVAD